MNTSPSEAIFLDSSAILHYLTGDPLGLEVL